MIAYTVIAKTLKAQELLVLKNEHSDPGRVDMPFGIYQHYKGDRYLILGLGFASTNKEAEALKVYYLSFDKGTLHDRLHTEFHEMMRWPDGIARPRFCYEPFLSNPDHPCAMGEARTDLFE